MAMRLIAWNPVLDAGRTSCTLDLSPNDAGVAGGTPELMKAVLEEVGIAAEPREWEVHPFCTPYYAATAAKGDDRLDLAWRVTVRFAEPCAECELPPPFQPVGVDAIDGTWRLTESAWECAGRPVVVLADWDDDSFHQVLRDDPRFRAVTGAARVELDGIVQTRLELGGASWPEHQDLIIPVLQACEEHGASVYWGSTLAGTRRRRWA